MYSSLLKLALEIGHWKSARDSSRCKTLLRLSRYHRVVLTAKASTAERIKASVACVLLLGGDGGGPFRRYACFADR